MLDSDEKIENQCILWEKKDCLAVDFECEFNLHVYGEHLCLIQVFDGDKFFIIDPRSKDVSVKGLETFFSLDTKKLWFDCQSDSALVYKNYGLKINNIIDLRVYAKALGFQGNLLSLEKEFLGLNILVNKKKNQQANWMKRPIDTENLEYALLDVASLMDLEVVLKAKCKERKLDKNVDSAMKKATSVKEPEPGWKRIGSWRHYNDEQKLIVKHIYISRDKIAKRFNVPASRVLEKQKIIDLAINPPKRDSDIDKRLASVNSRFKSFIVPAVKDALIKAREDFSNKVRI